MAGNETRNGPVRDLETVASRVIFSRIINGTFSSRNGA